MRARRVGTVMALMVVAAAAGAQQADRGLEVRVRELGGEYAVAGKQYAVLVAIDRYRTWPALKNPVRDAQELREILERRYYVDEFVELYDTEATKAGIYRLFGSLIERTRPEDSVFIFYAGHGYLDSPSKTGFWIPVDGGTDKYAQENWIPNTQIRGFVGNIKARHVVLVSDSCFSGDMLNPARGVAGEITNEYFRNAYQRVSRQVLTSGASESVPDTSLFALQLKLALEGNRQPYLDPLMLYSEVRLGVSGSMPLFGSLEGAGHQEGGSFLLFLKERAAATAATPLASVSPARASSAATGELYVITNPSGAEVSVDGESKGTSPLLIKDVPVGRRLRVEARTGNRAASTELTLDRAGLQDLNLVLQTEKGNLVIVTAERAVRVALDGRALGELGNGLFRDIEVGSHVLELTGSGVYWKGEVAVAAGKTTDLRAEPFVVGEITYDIPEGAQAELSAKDVRTVLRGSGRLQNLYAQTYTLRVTGTDYEALDTTVTVIRAQTARVAPTLKRTEGFQRTATYNELSSVLADVAKLAVEGRRVETTDLSQAKAVESKIAAATFRFQDLADRAKKLRETIASRVDKQTADDARVDFARRLSGLERLRSAGSYVAEADVSAAERLSGEIAASSYATDELRRRGRALVDVLTKVDSLSKRWGALERELAQIKRSRDRLLIAGGVGGGVGLACVGLALLFHSSGTQARAEYDAARTADGATAAWARVSTYTTLLNVSIVAGSVGVGVGSILLLAAPRTSLIMEQIQSVERELDRLRSGGT